MYNENKLKWFSICRLNSDSRFLVRLTTHQSVYVCKTVLKKDRNFQVSTTYSFEQVSFLVDISISFL